MSSYSNGEFIAELKGSSAIVAEFTDAQVAIFLTVALRHFSLQFAELRVSADNEVVDGQELYDLPANAVSIVKVRDSDSKAEITFAVENQGEGDKIRLGSIAQNSMADLLERTYYQDPLASASSSQVTGYSAFDVEYTLLHDMETIKDTSLDAVAAYVQYLACNSKAGEAAASAVSSAERVPESITDQDSSGASTTIKYSSSREMSTVLKQQANEALERYNDLTRSMAYGTRG